MKLGSINIRLENKKVIKFQKVIKEKPENRAFNVKSY